MRASVPIKRISENFGFDGLRSGQWCARLGWKPDSASGNWAFRENDRFRLPNIQKLLASASASASLNAVFDEFYFGFGFVIFLPPASASVSASQNFWPVLLGSIGLLIKLSFTNLFRFLFELCCISIQNKTADLDERWDEPHEAGPVKRSKLLALLEKRAGSSMTQQAVPSSGACEMKTYIEMSLVAGDKDPLKFWRENTSNCPLLSKMAQNHLSVPVSSAPVGRLFERSSVQKEIVSLISFPKHWWLFAAMEMCRMSADIHDGGCAEYCGPSRVRQIRHHRHY